MAKPLQKVRGFSDHLPQSLAKHKKIISTAFKVSSRFCFQPVETPIVEQVDVFRRAMEESTVVNKEMYLVENSGESLALRPEGTASIARMFITEKLEKQHSFKEESLEEELNRLIYSLLRKNGLIFIQESIVIAP